MAHGAGPEATLEIYFWNRHSTFGMGCNVHTFISKKVWWTCQFRTEQSEMENKTFAQWESS